MKVHKKVCPKNVGQASAEAVLVCSFCASPPKPLVGHPTNGFGAILELHVNKCRLFFVCFGLEICTNDVEIDAI